MVCVYCKSKTHVTNSRPQKRLNQVWRRRECTECKSIFTTQESTDLNTAYVVQYNNHVQPFLRDKLFLSVHESLRHRPNALNEATELTKTIISKLTASSVQPSLLPEHIIKTTYQTLHNFDTSAAVHYRAFHPQQLAKQG